MSRRFVRRAAAFVFLAFLFFAFVVASFVVLLINAFNSPGAGGGSAIFVPLAILAVVIVAFAVARGIRRLVIPLGDLIDAAQSVEAGDYGARVRPRGPRELRALARAFNAMSERLETSEEQRRRLLADVTHELRTPLTIMQGNLEALLDGLYPADAEHLEPILDGRSKRDSRAIGLRSERDNRIGHEVRDVGGLAMQRHGAGLRKR